MDDGGSVAESTAERRAGIPLSVERLVTRAARDVQLLGALTPNSVATERGRLVTAIRERKRASPLWTYRPVGHTALRRALDAAERVLERVREPLHALYLARVRELSLEAALCEAAGTAAVAALARERFDVGDVEAARTAADLCSAWLAEPPVAAGGDPVVSDDPGPASLLSQMRRAVGELHLPFAVVPQPSLAALAATGDRFIIVASARRVAPEDAARTVLHEIEGHALPRSRAWTAPVALARSATARGIDDQEGRALVLEERAGMLGPRRRRHLAGRHMAVLAMHDGASFADVASALVGVHGFDAGEAVLVAERAFRGGDGAHPGLGRERVYLESFVRVRAALAARPEDEALMSAGQIAIDAVEPLRAYV